MAAPGFTISHSAPGLPGASSLTVTLRHFSGSGVAQSYVDTATLNFSAAGSALQSGMTRAARRLWAVSTLVEKADALLLKQIYEQWDAARAYGLSSTCSITDEVSLGDAPASGTAVFTEPVSAERLPNGSPLYRVSFSLTEV